MALAIMAWIVAIPLLGGLTGLRTFTPLAVLCWFAYVGHLEVDGTWGAWELGLRYSDIDLNYHAGVLGTAPAAEAIRGGEERNFALGLNWWANPLAHFMLDYEHVKIDRLSPNAVLYQTPTGAQIGQSYDTVAVRSQFAF